MHFESDKSALSRVSKANERHKRSEVFHRGGKQTPAPPQQKIPFRRTGLVLVVGLEPPKKSKNCAKIGKKCLKFSKNNNSAKLLTLVLTLVYRMRER